MTRALAALLFMIASAIACAQNANQDAKQLAQRLGRERSVEGLETIAKSRNRELLEWYDRGYRETWIKDRRAPHPPGIEAPLRAWLADAKPGSEDARTIESFLAVLTAPPPPPLTPEQQRQAKRAEIGARIAEAEKLRTSDPKAYVAATEAALGEAGDSPEAGMAWLQLGNFTRFRLHDPRRALELYAKAERTGMGMAIFAQGDTWQFDLRDRKRAIAEYRRNLAQLRGVHEKGNSGETQIVEWGVRWLENQVAFLETGRTFTGAIGREDIAGAGMLTMFGAVPTGKEDDLGLFPGGHLDPADIPRGLADLPPSGWTLMRTASVLGGMPDAKSILAFMARNDPAGYASACFFGLVEMSQQQAKEGGGMITRGANRMFAGSKALQEAKARFLRERKISLQP